MNEVKPISAPQESLADKALAIGKALLGDIVPLGGTFTELAGQFIRTPYQRRAEEWQEQVGEALFRLSADKGVRLEDLQQDPKFVDTVLHATQVALRNSNNEKRAALQNAIRNAGLPSAPDESQRQMFLNYIDSFTPWHLRLLALFNDPTGWFKAREKSFPSITMGARSHVLEAAYPEARRDEAFFRQVWRDLHACGLAATESLSGMMSEQGIKQAATTPTGAQFLRFVSEPLAA